MRFSQETNAIIAKGGNETLEVRAWGKNALRVRATQYPSFTGKNVALEYVEPEDVVISIAENKAEIRNGKIRCEIYKAGWLVFYKEKTQILKEYYRSFWGVNEHSPSMKVYARDFKALTGGDYSITMRFEANEEEKIYGMGQYQQPNLNLKGCILELAQRNSQISIPFYLSSLGYGFLWNNAGVGEVMFGANYTQWNCKSAEELDYWITADDTPKKIIGITLR